ncbi:hypothetical protein NQ318_022607 [Aromia moschata]|uniref:PiggyBac transposable element-derived protein domain-containing protein n=1 Tax=Aromia moschata TaxID=1265417 RepID=A0AAV8XDF0_9CUCU|nr:hypothetical protein NQ318_022607 [Aromia moschata]
MKKKNRGDYDFALDNKQKLLIVRWMDNYVVTVASTAHGIKLISMASRYSTVPGVDILLHRKKRIAIPCPNLGAQYNQFMEGTDQMDANVGTYRITIREKKWY